MKKFLFFVAWLGIFILSITGIVYAIYPNYFLVFNISSFKMKIIILNISIIYLILTLLKLKSKFPKKTDFEMDAPNGKIFISSDSIKSMVKESLSTDDSINLVKVETKKSGARFDLMLHIESSLNTNIADKTVAIQENIRKTIKKNIGIDINNIEVKLLKIKNQQ